MSGFAISPDSLQNIYLMFVEIDPSTTVTVQSVSSSNVTWTRAVQVFSGGKDFEMWTGVPTGLGDSTVNFTFTGSVSQSNVETGRQQFQSSLPAPHWTVTGGWDAYPSGNTIVYPALQVAPGGGYWAYGKTTNAGSAGGTPGFFYDVTPQANVVAYSTSATGLVSPTAPTLPGSGPWSASLYRLPNHRPHECAIGDTNGTFMPGPGIPRPRRLAAGAAGAEGGGDQRACRARRGQDHRPGRARRRAAAAWRRVRPRGRGRGRSSP